MHIRWKKLIFTFILCESVGSIGSLFVRRDIFVWYESLLKPTFNPPNWVFFPVWTALYALMAMSLYLVWVKKATFKVHRSAYLLFGGQLLINLLWTILFFGMRNIFFGLVDIAILFWFIGVMGLYFYRIDKRAAYLLIPYFIWVGFAGYLNYAIWILNG